MMMRVKRKLETIIKEGANLADFKAWSATQALGWSRAYTELIFRQAVFGSYAGARFRQINQPAVAKVFEYLIYEAVADERTRPEHARMGGTEWKRDEFPSSWWPQNGFNCRCEVRTVTKEMKNGLGTRPWPARTELPKPDKGFVRNYNSPESQRLLMNNVLRNLRRSLGQ
jgi:SPP1 gp7 family putative phage head morphogenesis protein